MTNAVQLAQYGAVQNSFKNRIINGGMVIDQRNAGASVSANGAFPVDRFKVVNSTDGTYTGQQTASSLSGFYYSTKVTIGTADTSLTTTQNLRIEQDIEGFNIADLAWGTANAQTVTLSFRVYSSLTGTFGGSVLNSAQNRSYPFSYSIPVANTWTTISITIAGDTTGTWLTTNGVGIMLVIGLGVASSISGTAGSWSGNTYYSATGAVSVVGTSGATFYITGVQLEKGSVATSFDYRPYGTELSLCQRYYETGNSWIRNDYRSDNSAAFGASCSYQIYKRVNPTMVILSTAGSSNTSSQSLNVLSPTSFFIQATGIVSTGGQSGQVFQSSWTASAEL